MKGFSPCRLILLVEATTLAAIICWLSTSNEHFVDQAACFGSKPTCVEI